MKTLYCFQFYRENCWIGPKKPRSFSQTTLLTYNEFKKNALKKKGAGKSLRVEENVEVDEDEELW